MARISSLVTEYNTIDKATIANNVTSDIARWITSMVNTFGLNGEAAPGTTTIGWSGIDIPEHAKPYVSIISQTRDELRIRARSSQGITAQDLQELERKLSTTTAEKEEEEDATAPYRQVQQDIKTQLGTLQTSSSSSNLSKDILSLCDRLRDHDLWRLNIYLEDRDGQPALIRSVTRELLASRAEKENQAQQKQQVKAEKERLAAEKKDKGRVSHLEMFRTSEYSAWDEEGLPMRDKEGGEITKSKEKKLRKEWGLQKKLHEAWAKANEAGSGGERGKGAG